MTKEEMIAKIRKQDPYYEHIDLESEPFTNIDRLLDHVSSTPATLEEILQQGPPSHELIWREI